MTTAYLVRFAHTHETFRQPELEALAELDGLTLQWVHYTHDSPFAIITIDEAQSDAAKSLIARSILCHSIHELWGRGESYDSLHQDVRSSTAPRWPRYRESSFRFDIDTFQASNNSAVLKKAIIDSFAYLPFDGRIVMKRPDQVFTVFEEYRLNGQQPHTLFFGRWLADSGRKIINTYDLKKRKYIATTSMDAELSLLTANIALAAPGKLAYDPFMGTGSFPVSCAAFGATTFGSDLDGRSIRGKGGRTVAANFEQYGKASQYLGGFSADLTNTPVAARPYLDIVICDPPYGVREGLKVLGHVKERLHTEVILDNGMPAHLQQDYVPPKRPYSFTRMLADILDFSAATLVADGRLCMWMPVAGKPHDEVNPDTSVEEQDISSRTTEASSPAPDLQEYAIPKHPCLRLVSVSQQDFNKWSRRLLTYSKRHEADIELAALAEYREQQQSAMSALLGKTKADDLNDFRKKYFEGFKE